MPDGRDLLFHLYRQSDAADGRAPLLEAAVEHERLRHL
jgi:hypothetical protein